MFHKKRIIVALIVIMALIGLWTAAASGAVEQKSVLGGKVNPQDLVVQGTIVHEGDILVRVDTLAGAQPAARATVDGKVVDVLVKPTDTISIGDVVARIEPQRK